MRFTKIPLIATLMAVALSLLIVLPALGQTTDITDGRGKGGPITVGVFDDINDAQLGKLEETDFTAWPGGVAPDPLPWVPVGSQTPNDLTDDTPSPIPGISAGLHSAGDAAYFANRAVDPQDTFFQNTLYVSNDVGAFNTVLVNVAHDPVLTGADLTCVADVATTTDVNERDAGDARVTAIVRNNRSGQSITMELVGVSGGAASQAFFKVVESGDTGTYDPDGTPGNDDDRELPFRQFGGPTWCDDAKTRMFDSTDDDTDNPTPVEVETAATSAAYGPIPLPGEGLPLAGDAPAAAQEIATIFARHGDRLTVSVPGQSGTVDLTVDGDGPDFSAITPEDNDVVRSSRLEYSFEVRDDDSGLRHDGEAQLTPDDDYEEVNPDGDPHLETEPLSKNPGASVRANGPAADIDVNVADNPMSITHTPGTVSWEDISASGTWRIAGSRAGVAYVFTASGADKGDDDYLYQLRARDRAGNLSVTDADDDRDAPGDQPFVFRVDDEEPDLMVARTGISWNSEDNKEEADRSYIALTFTSAGGADAIGDVDTDSITVVGHSIVGYIHPSAAPAINRNEGAPDRDDYDPVQVRYAPVERTAPEATALADARAADPRTAAHNTTLINQGRFDRYTSTQTILGGLGATDDAVEPLEPTTAEPSDCSATVVADAAAADIELCGQWVEYRAELALYNTGLSDKVAATERHTKDAADFAKDLMPGTDIEGEDFAEPRSRIYIELAEELASDETPTVQVVGGAVRDLAGNTNDAETLGGSNIQDWIAPKLTVTVTGTAADRQVANAEDGSFTVDVRADEDVTRPRVFFVALSAAEGTDSAGEGTGEYVYTIGPAGDGTNEANSLTAQEDDNHWNRKYKVNAGDLSSFKDGLVGVIVFTDDDADNTGATAGWTPKSHREAAQPKAAVGDMAGDKLNLSKMDDAGLIVEIDRLVTDAGEVFVTPRSDSDGKETESSNPFVKLDFSGEGSEYEVCERDDDGDCMSEVKSEYKDSHSRVDVAEITVNGDDALASLARIDSNEFSLVLRDLEVGEYKVWYAVTDDAGNKSDEGNFTFEVLPRSPYEVDVTPGWNLISLPATPLEPAIGSVLANNPYISPVLAYQQGDWVTAIQQEDGTWRGRLTEITGGYGYWVHARTFETIETMLAETDPASTLPTVPVTQGWNLLGVLDVHQNDQGEAPGETTEDADGNDVVGNAQADDYFKSIPWRVAYTYDTTASLWVKTVPNDNDDKAGDNGEIENGMGYWVWSNSPSTLAP